MNSATFTNHFGETVRVQIGDVVGFKSDIEQCGTVIAIERSQTIPGRFVLTLANPHGFQGAYLEGQERTQVSSVEVSKEF